MRGQANQARCSEGDHSHLPSRRWNEGGPSGRPEVRLQPGGVVEVREGVGVDVFKQSSAFRGLSPGDQRILIAEAGHYIPQHGFFTARRDHSRAEISRGLVLELQRPLEPIVEILFTAGSDLVADYLGGALLGQVSANGHGSTPKPPSVIGPRPRDSRPARSGGYAVRLGASAAEPNLRLEDHTVGTPGASS